MTRQRLGVIEGDGEAAFKGEAYLAAAVRFVNANGGALLSNEERLRAVIDVAKLITDAQIEF